MSPEAFDRLRRVALSELSARVVKIPSTWSMVQVYQSLVDDGNAKSEDSGNPLMKAFSITPQGLQRLPGAGDLGLIVPLPLCVKVKHVVVHLASDENWQ